MFMDQKIKYCKNVGSIHLDLLDSVQPQLESW